MRSRIRRVIGWCLECWIERRAEKRQMDDADLLVSLANATQETSSVEPQWNRLPQRLRYRFQKKLKEILQETAESGNPLIVEVIKNARICEINISPEEELALYKKALDASRGLRNKLFFAKRIHGENLPLVVVLDLIPDTSPLRDWMYNADKSTEELLREIDPSDPEQREKFAMKIASLGRYFQLLRFYKIAEEPIPKHVLLACFEAAKSNRDTTPSELISLCNATGDWDYAKVLIRRWTEDWRTHRHGTYPDHAARLALLRHHALEREAASATS